MVIYFTKTNYRISAITADIVASAVKNPFTHCTVFCEDKNTLSLETEIAERLGGSFNVTVTSFSRYVMKNSPSERTLTKIGSALAVYKVMSELGENLKRLRPNGKPSLASGIYELISQLKSAKVTAEELKNIAESESGGAFGSKLGDLAEIYSAYESYLEERNAADSSRIFDEMPKIAVKDKKLLGSKVVFSGFSSVTRQIADVFTAVAGVADCDFVLLRGDGGFYTNEVYSKVCALFPAAETVSDGYEFLPEIRAIEARLYSPEKMKEVPLESDKVRIFEVDSPYAEAENAARRIRYDVVVKGRRFKDFAVAAGDLDGYGSVFKSVFEDYGIPLYVDARSSLSNHPLARLVSKMLDAVRLNFGLREITALSRETLIADARECAAFERYAAKNAVSRSRLKAPFKVVAEEDGLAESVRARIMDACRKIPQSGTASEYVSAIRQAAESLNAEKKLTELGARLRDMGAGEEAAVNDRAFKIIDRLLSELESTVGEKPMRAAEFKATFLSAVAAAEVSVLPLYNDMVFMGDFKSVRQREVKVLFAVGLTSDVPGVKQDTALLNDKDLMKMEKYKCVVEPTIRVVNRRERESFGVALASFSEKLYASYPRRDLSGQQTARSEAIEYLSAIFGILPISRDDAASAGVYAAENDVYGYTSLRSGLKQFALDAGAFRAGRNSHPEAMSAFYAAARESCPNELNAVLTDRDRTRLKKGRLARLSASVVECHFSCPYKCFAKYTLKIKSADSGEVESFEFGNLLHGVLERFVAEIDGVHSQAEAERRAEELFEQALCGEDFAKYLDKPQYKRLFVHVKREAKSRAGEIFNEFENSEFKPVGCEVAFGDLDGARLPAILIETKGGVHRISGKVDRVDCAPNGLLRIIDYKTGSAEDKSDPVQLYAGTHVQLYLYANAFSDGKDLAGVYYYKLDNDFEDTDAERRRFFGKTVLDEGVALSTDTRLKESDDSPKYGITFKTKDGKRTLSDKSTMVSAEGMRAFVKYAKKVAASGADEIRDGLIIASPHEGACDFCEFGGMCGFDAETDFLTRSVKIEGEEVIVRAAEDEDEKHA